MSALSAGSSSGFPSDDSGGIAVEAPTRRVVDQEDPDEGADLLRLLQALQQPQAEFEPEYFHDAGGCSPYAQIRSLREFRGIRLLRT